MLIDSGRIIRLQGRQPTFIATREELKIYKAMEEWEKFFVQGWRKSKLVC